MKKEMILKVLYKITNIISLKTGCSGFIFKADNNPEDCMGF